MPRHGDFGFQRSTRSEQLIKMYQTNLQRSLIDRTIDRFASVSQLLWVCGRDNDGAPPEYSLTADGTAYDFHAACLSIIFASSLF